MSRPSKSMKAMNDRIYALRESVVIITQMLAGKSIKVTQRGMQACVTPDEHGRPVSVNLPYIPDNATDELCEAIQGFLDHEVAHIMFTDFKAFNNIAHNPGLHNLANIIEDARIEKLMGKAYQGCANNLATTGNFFLDKYTIPKMQEAQLSGDDEQMAAVLTVPLIRALSGQAVFEEFISGKEHLFPDVVAKLTPFKAEFESLTDSASVIRVASAVRKALTGEEEQEEQEGSGSGPGRAKSRPKKGAGGGAAGGGAASLSEEEESPGGGLGLEEEEEEKPVEEEKEESEEEEKEESEESEEEEEKEEFEEEEREEHKSESSATTSGSAFLNALDKETANDYDSSLSNIITGDALETGKHADYLVYSRDGDKVEPLHVGKGYKEDMFTKGIAEETDHMVGPLQKDLERAIVARSASTHSNGHKSGKLHAANLSRLIVNDPRVFRRKITNTTKDVAVELVVDLSGSMGGAKIVLATQAAYALASVLERLKIPCEVISFTTGEISGDRNKIAEEEKRMGRQYTRLESLFMPVIKGFNENMNTEVKRRFGWLPNCSTMQNNIDGECVEIAARRLLQRREQGKVMIVLSDGHPACRGDNGRLGQHLKAVVKEIERNNVNVIGIGIKSEAVKQFYPKNVVLENVDELPGRVLTELRHLLIPR